MYRVYKGDEIVATVSNLTWIKKSRNGSFAISGEDEAEGVAIDGTAYHVVGKPAIEGVESVVIGVLNETDYQKEQIAALNAATLPASIVFVTLSEAGQIDDVTITENVSQFSKWVEDCKYTKGAIRVDPDDGNVYRCVQAHTSQGNWKPHEVAALWVKIGDPTVEFPEWAQPVGAHDAYTEGAKVTYKGKHYISIIDGNVWSPDTYGWVEAEE